MGYALSQVYALFTGELKPFIVFEEKIRTEPKRPSMAELMVNPSAATEMQAALIERVMERQMNKSINIGATVFFQYFLMLFGFRLSSLGVQLVRPITVKLRSNVVEADTKAEETSEKSITKTT